MATTTPTNQAQDAGRGADLLAGLLHEALATEEALVTTLRAHSRMAPPGDYRELLERHLEETRAQASALRERLGEVDAGHSLVRSGIGLAQTVLGQALALGKAPLDLVRGGSPSDKLLKNARDECATEAFEIATYDAIQALADMLGDTETAALAQRHRAQEERMLDGLRHQMRELAHAVARERAGGEGGGAA
jgi:ferritin-like metal-binding protein YciE